MKTKRTCITIFGILVGLLFPFIELVEAKPPSKQASAQARAKTVEGEVESQFRLTMYELEVAIEQQDWKRTLRLYQKLEKHFGSSTFVSTLATKMKEWETQIEEGIKGRLRANHQETHSIIGKIDKLIREKHYSLAYLTLEGFNEEFAGAGVPSALKEKLSELSSQVNVHINKEDLMYDSQYVINLAPPDDLAWQKAVKSGKRRIAEAHERDRKLGLTAVRFILEEGKAGNMIHLSTENRINIYRDSGYRSSEDVTNGEVVLIGTDEPDKAYNGAIELSASDHFSPRIAVFDFNEGQITRFGEIIVRRVSEADKGCIEATVVPEEGLSVMDYEVTAKPRHGSGAETRLESTDDKLRFISPPLAPREFYVRVKTKPQSNLATRSSNVRVESGQTKHVSLYLYRPREVTIEWWYRQPDKSDEWLKGVISLDTVRQRYFDARELWELEHWSQHNLVLEGYTEENLFLTARGYPLLMKRLDVDGLSDEIEFPTFDEMGQRRGAPFMPPFHRQHPIKEGDVYALMLVEPHRRPDTQGQYGQVLLRVKKIAAKE